MPAVLNPWLLFGLAAAGLPVLIHFLTRPRPRAIRLPTFHLLAAAGGGRQALDRLRTFVILTLRTLAVVALALVFARPFIRHAAAPAPGEAPRVVLLLDASMSMRATAGGVTRFARAKAQAADVLRRLEQGSEAGVVLIGARPHCLLPALSRNLPALHEGLAQSTATCEGGDPVAALAEAERLLGGRGTVYVFSDMQRGNWGAVDFARHPGLDVIVRQVGEAPADNVGITGLECSPQHPVAGETVEIACSLFNASSSVCRRRVSLELGGGVRHADAELLPYSSGSVRFSFAHPHPDLLAGTVAIERDGLGEDDRRHLALQVRDRLAVLLLSDGDPQRSTAGAFFVRHALAPSRRGAAGIAVTCRGGQAADRHSLETADAFVLVPPLMLGGEVVEVLARRIDEGADLICFLDGPGARPLLSMLAGASDGGVRPPFTLGEPVRTVLPLAEPERHRGPLRIFHGRDQGDLAGLRTTRHLLTSIDAERAHEVFLHHADGAAALTIGPAGRGRAAFFNLPVTPDGGTIPGSPLFPALLHETLRSMRRGDDAGTHVPGRDWSIDVVDAGTGSLQVLAPDGATVPATVVSRGRAVRLAMPPVGAPGLYPVRAGEQRVGVGVVNVDPVETDTRPVAVSSLLDTATAGARVRVVDEGGDLVDAARPRVLWPQLLIIAAACLAAEMLVLALWRRRPPGARVVAMSRGSA